MAAIRPVEPVVRFCAVISRHAEVRHWAVEQLVARWGSASICSDVLPFEAGGFYDHEMGRDLGKVLVAFDQLADPAGLADWKHETYAIESTCRSEQKSDTPRPLNLDPGYITQAKLVLATIKDRDHRLYLRNGMFAEVTLNYVGKRWIHHRWTYPDYRTEAVADFAMRCRNQLRVHLHDTGGFRAVK